MTSPEHTNQNDDASGKPLPELNGAVLSMDQVRDLFRDIATCTELLEILPKYATAERAPDRASLTLEEAARLLETRAVRGIQLRYRYDGNQWWDTLLQAETGYRIVRIRHEF